MAVPLLMVGAVPFNLPRESIASRRQKIPPQLDPQQVLLAQVVAEAADAVQFILGPQHRSGTSSSSPSYRLPLEKMTPGPPPNTPHTKLQFEFDPGHEADCSDEEVENKTVDKTRKRRRVCSFSNSTPSSRRVPNKKPATVSQETQTETVVSSSLDHSSIVPRLHFYQEIQTVADRTGVDEDRWKKIGASLRNIADRLGHHHQRNKKNVLVETDPLPGGIWMTVFKYFFWKFCQSFK